MKRNWMAVAGALCLCAAAAEPKAGHDEHEHDEHAHGHAHAVHVAEAVQRVMGLKTVRPERRRLRSTVALTGRFELMPDARSTVATPVAGRLSVLVKPLARVKKGEALFTVEAPELSARAREIAVLERRLEVYRKIGTANAQLESELAVKKAEREALIGTAREKDGVVTVCAATDGRVETFSSESGAWVETGAPVVRLVRPEAVRLRALAAASDIAQLVDGLTATVDGVAGELRLGIGDERGLVPVYVVFPKGNVRARAGERATAVCVTDETERPVLAVPARAIVQIGLRPTVFVRDEHDADRFRAVDVVPGISSGGWTAVTGLPEGHDLEVVVEGAYELKLVLPAGNAAPAGHFHADGTFHEGSDEPGK
ncbi:MAG: efflux RND transporter periplasmic adaptor subunit [Kiritimatiellia bacterium]